MSPSTIWLIVMVVLVLGELATVGLTFIWFAVGALGGAITAWMGGAIWVQVIVFLALSGLALALVRPLAARYLDTKNVATNADRVIGKTAIVIQDIDNIEGKGQVNISGQIWSARSHPRRYGGQSASYRRGQGVRRNIISACKWKPFRK